MVLGTFVRFLELTGKPPWTDEFATLVFSSGNRFDSVPLERLVSIDTLLEPLRVDRGSSLSDVVGSLLRDDNHPPLYFVLAHLWMKLFADEGGYISLFGARSLPALFGVLAIPSSYLLGRVAFSSRSVGQLCAAMMAFSPYAVFSAQEARHYTLAILFAIASLVYFSLVARALHHGRKIPYSWVFWWWFGNGLGLLTHYFFVLTIAAEALTLSFLASERISRRSFSPRDWSRVGLAFGGTFSFFSLWFFTVVPGDHGNQMTGWIVRDTRDLSLLLDPVFQLMGTGITMVSLLPVESENLVIVLFSGAIMLAFFLYVIPRFKVSWSSVDSLELRVFVGFVASSIALFFFISYILSLDITKGARYSFVYFPAVILIVAVLLEDSWRRGGRRLVAGVLLMAFVSSICVTVNLGYRKYYRPDRLVPILRDNSTDAVPIVTHYKSLVQVGEMMGIAREYRRRFPEREPRFLFVSRPEELKDIVLRTGSPALWLVNFPNPIESLFHPIAIDLPRCRQVSGKFPPVAGYEYRKYSCPR
jgi:uncharacterized membrane protein